LQPKVVISSRDLLLDGEKQVSPLRVASLREATTPVEMTGYLGIEPLPNSRQREKCKGAEGFSLDAFIFPAGARLDQLFSLGLEEVFSMQPSRHQQ
ncbi:MAG: hypothetical protein ABJA69_12240, partial [Acidobacteriaceae bacterium]